MQNKVGRPPGEMVMPSVGGTGLAGAGVQRGEASTALDRSAINDGEGGGGSGASEDYGTLNCMEKYDPS